MAIPTAADFMEVAARIEVGLEVGSAIVVAEAASGMAVEAVDFISTVAAGTSAATVFGADLQHQPGNGARARIAVRVETRFG